MCDCIKKTPRSLCGRYCTVGSKITFAPYFSLVRPYIWDFPLSLTEGMAETSCEQNKAKHSCHYQQQVTRNEILQGVGGSKPLHSSTTFFCRVRFPPRMEVRRQRRVTRLCSRTSSGEENRRNRRVPKHDIRQMFEDRGAMKRGMEELV